MNLILLVDEQDALSEEGEQTLFIEEDLAHFQQVTTGNAVIMGRRTYENMGKLKNRVNIVLTSHDYEDEEDLYFVKDRGALRELLETLPEGMEAYCIGGAGVVESLIDDIDRATLTRVHVTLKNPDRFAPNLRVLPGWELLDTEVLENEKYEAEIEYWQKN